MTDEERVKKLEGALRDLKKLKKLRRQERKLWIGLVILVWIFGWLAGWGPEHQARLRAEDACPESVEK